LSLICRRKIVKAEKAKWKPVELSLCGAIVNQKQYYIFGGIADIRDIICSLIDAGEMVPTTAHQFSCLAYAEDSWILENDRDCYIARL
jgi:hypothetical protein